MYAQRDGEGETIVFDCVNLQSGDSCHQTCAHWWRAQCELACWCPWQMSLWQTRPAMEIKSIKLISIFTFYHLQIDTHQTASSRTNKHVQSVPHKTFRKPFFFFKCKKIRAANNSRSGTNLKKQKQTKRKTNTKAGFPVKESLETCHKPFLLVCDKFPVCID